MATRSSIIIRDLGVDWSMANTYCKWAGRNCRPRPNGKRPLRGTDGRIYPWGNGAPNRNLLNYNNNVGDTTEVGSFVNGASPYTGFWIWPAM